MPEPMTGGYGPRWLHQRAIGQDCKSSSASLESLRRLQLEHSLEGHSGCVNCLEWNQEGNLLASGSDDRTVIIWSPLDGNRKTTVNTGHQGNIFSVKFMPQYSENVVATCASDGQVKLTDTIASKNLINCNSCHIDRVKRLATHPNEPYLIWSAGEEGYIMQYDIREEHICRPSKPKKLLLDLSTASLSAKCLAINPIKDEMLAVGCNDAYIRLYDRRYIQPDKWNISTAYFTPGHIIRRSKKIYPNSFGTTYLAFSPTGSELLANLHAEQVYLFNTYEPWEDYKSFESTVKPLILNQQLDYEPARRIKGIHKPFSLWRDLRRLDKCSKMSREEEEFCNEVRGDDCLRVTMKQMDRLNEILAQKDDCPELYCIRASALIRRGWRGDCWQAIRDCCCALALRPLDIEAIKILTRAACCSGDKEIASGLAEIIKALQQIIVESEGFLDLEVAYSQLTALLRDNRHSPVYWQSRSASSDSDDSMNDLVNESQDRQVPIDTMILPNPTLIDNAGDCSVPVLNSMLADRNLKENRRRSSSAYDYTKRFCGHCNMNTDIKEVNFLGSDGEFVVGGSDDGSFYIWDKRTANIIKAVHGDCQTLNCVQPHPTICMLATSGIESSVKIWSSTGKTCKDVQSIEVRCGQNQEFIAADPLEAMMMMLYPVDGSARLSMDNIKSLYPNCVLESNERQSITFEGLQVYLLAHSDGYRDLSQDERAIFSALYETMIQVGAVNRNLGVSGVFGYMVYVSLITIHYSLGRLYRDEIEKTQNIGFYEFARNEPREISRLATKISSNVGVLLRSIKMFRNLIETRQSLHPNSVAIPSKSRYRDELSMLCPDLDTNAQLSSVIMTLEKQFLHLEWLARHPLKLRPPTRCKERNRQIVRIWTITHLISAVVFWSAGILSTCLTHYVCYVSLRHQSTSTRVFSVADRVSFVEQILFIWWVTDWFSIPTAMIFANVKDHLEHLCVIRGKLEGSIRKIHRYSCNEDNEPSEEFDRELDNEIIESYIELRSFIEEIHPTLAHAKYFLIHNIISDVFVVMGLLAYGTTTYTQSSTSAMIGFALVVGVVVLNLMLLPCAVLHQSCIRTVNLISYLLAATERLASERRQLTLQRRHTRSIGQSRSDINLAGTFRLLGRGESESPISPHTRLLWRRFVLDEKMISDKFSCRLFSQFRVEYRAILRCNFWLASLMMLFLSNCYDNSPKM